MRLPKIRGDLSQCRIWADGAFIQICDEEITTDDFVGDSYRLEYSIKRKNYMQGRIMDVFL